MSFEEAYKEYLLYAAKRHKKQSFVTLQSDFNSKIVPYFKDYTIHLTKLDILNWQNYINSLNLAYSYESKLYIEFGCFMDFCCNFYGLEYNPVKAVGNFTRKFQEKKTDFYTLKEFNTFIKYVSHPVYKVFFDIMFFTGTRPGEAMALKFSDLKGDYLSITKNLTTKGGRVLDTPKNQSSIRTIRIDKRLKKEILQLKKYYEKKYGFVSGDYFILGGIKPISPTTINRYKKSACVKAHIRPITLHQFRHSHATLLLQNGIVINEISRRLGHSKVSTTLDIYTHTNSEQEKRVTSTLNSIRFNFLFTLQSDFQKIKSILKHLTMF